MEFLLFSIRQVRLFVFFATLAAVEADEFRFCSNGLHRVIYTECKYGIYFPEPITSACIVHLPESGANAGNDAILIRLVSSLCDADSPQESEMTRSIAYTNITFQHVNFLPIRSRNQYSFYQATGTECNAECQDDLSPLLSDENDEDQLDAENPFELIPQITPEITLAQKDLSRSFVEYLLGLEDGNGSISENYALQDNTKDPRLLKLFRSSIEILQLNCGDPWVPYEYWDTIYYAFKWMFKRLVPSDFMDIGIEQYKIIRKILNDCQGISRTYELSGSVCDDRAKVISINVTNKDGSSSSIRYKPKLNSYRWGKHDIFMESAWAAVDFVHGFCFSSFNLDYNLEHIYFDGMDGLFNEEIQKRWVYFDGVKDEFYWDFLTAVPETKLVMRNINACLEASYLNSPYIHRIERPFYSQPIAASGVLATNNGVNSKLQIDDTSSWCAESAAQREDLLQYAAGRCGSN